MATDIWNDGTIWRLVGRYISVTGGSRRYRYEGVLVSVDDVSKTFTLAKRFAAKDTGNIASVTGVTRVPWVQGDNVKIVDLFEADGFDEIISDGNSRQFTDNFLLQVIRLSKANTFDTTTTPVTTSA